MTHLDQSDVVLRFPRSRAMEGDDIAMLIKRQLPEADIRAEFDQGGSVTGYTLILSFPDSDRAAEAVLLICEWLRENGQEPVVE